LLFLCNFWAEPGGSWKRCPRVSKHSMWPYVTNKVSEIFDITTDGLGELFEGDFADMCTGTFLLVSMG
jgi:hypothetical protein